MRALLTGSRVYGKPREDSDLDLVIEVNREERDLLINCGAFDSMYCFKDGQSYSFKFGKINLIVELESDLLIKGRFDKWVNATNVCEAAKPLEKDQYLKIFNILGIETPEFSSEGKV